VEQGLRHRHARPVCNVDLAALQAAFEEQLARRARLVTGGIARTPRGLLSVGLGVRKLRGVAEHEENAIRIVRSVLTPELLPPEWQNHPHAMGGYCYVASEGSTTSWAAVRPGLP
jgi:hypothetical protein